MFNVSVHYVTLDCYVVTQFCVDGQVQRGSMKGGGGGAGGPCSMSGSRCFVCC